MNLNKIKYELQHILSGKNGIGQDAVIQTIANHLRTSQRTSPVAEEKHQNKTKEAERLLAFAQKNNLIFDAIDEKNYISEGAEQKVYNNDNEYVLKLNDAIYYASWEDYFNNLLLHNYFFSDTAYHLLGFYIKQDTLYALVKQAYIKATHLTNLEAVKIFLTANGFENTKNHDYFHPYFGIIIEDLHDENVLTQNGILYFIDTVFYIKPDIFWQ